MTKYEKILSEVLEKSNTMLIIKHTDTQDGECEYKCTLKNKNGKYSFYYYEAEGKEVRQIDVIRTLYTDVPVDFDDFVESQGMDIESTSDYKRAERLYKTATKEYDKLSVLFTDDELYQLNKITQC